MDESRLGRAQCSADAMPIAWPAALDAGGGMEAPEEFTWLFRHEYVGVVWSANLVLHDHARAEEVAQDAFVRLLENWRKVSRYDRPGAWVRRVAFRLAVRIAKRQSRLVDLDEAWPIAAEARPLDLDLIAAIRQLPPQQRAAVALHYVEDLPVNEIAGALGCSVSTASVHLHRARTRLAELLGEVVGSHAD
jgi:RNA polymerase sigma-70 factor (ECF subfamily)